MYIFLQVSGQSMALLVRLLEMLKTTLIISLLI